MAKINILDSSVYNKIAGINYKKAAIGTLSVAGGISSGAVEAMDGVKKTSEGEE